MNMVGIDYLMLGIVRPVETFLLKQVSVLYAPLTKTCV